MSRSKSAGFCLSVLAGALLLPLSASAQTSQVKADVDILTTLNGRYQNTVTDCDGKSAFYCSGVLLSVDSTWTDGDSADGSASFSYLRDDMTIQQLYAGGYGYIFKDQGTAESDGDALNLYCAFAISASTNIRPDSTLGPSCGSYTVHHEPYNSCEEIGVDTYDEFIALLNSDPYIQDAPGYYQCGFDANDANGVLISIQAHDTVADSVADAFGPGYWNEIVIEGWHYNNAQIPPIEAFFYEAGSNTEANKAGAVAQRSDFESKTGIHVPVVGVDLTNSLTPFVASE